MRQFKKAVVIAQYAHVLLTRGTVCSCTAFFPHQPQENNMSAKRFRHRSGSITLLVVLIGLPFQAELYVASKNPGMAIVNELRLSIGSDKERSARDR